MGEKIADARKLLPSGALLDPIGRLHLRIFKQRNRNHSSLERCAYTECWRPYARSQTPAERCACTDTSHPHRGARARLPWCEQDQLQLRARALHPA
eukprot:3733638-Pyramimonas_sp.AAC.1